MLLARALFLILGFLYLFPFPLRPLLLCLAVTRRVLSSSEANRQVSVQVPFPCPPRSGAVSTWSDRELQVVLAAVVLAEVGVRVGSSCLVLQVPVSSPRTGLCCPFPGHREETSARGLHLGVLSRLGFQLEAPSSQLRGCPLQGRAVLTSCGALSRFVKFSDVISSDAALSLLLSPGTLCRWSMTPCPVFCLLISWRHGGYF